MKRGLILALAAAALAVCSGRLAAADTGSLAGRLQLMLDLDAYTWVPGQYMPRALVTYTNVSQSTIVFDRPSAGPRSEMVYDRTQWLVITGPQGQAVPSDDVGIIVDPPPGAEWDPTVTLAPGEGHSYFLSLIWWGYDFADILPAPGTYALQAVHEYFDVPRPTFESEEERIQWIKGNQQLLFSNVLQLVVLHQGAEVSDKVKLATNGNPVAPALPRMLVRGHLMADASVFTAAGAQLTKTQQSASITRVDKSVTLSVGRWPREMRDNHPPAVPIVGGGLLVPVRYVAEALGLRVHWDHKTKTANIITG